MRISGQTFGTDIIERIRKTLDMGVETTRSGLSRRVCEWLDWRSVSGKLRDIDARKALLALEDKGLIELPPAQSEPPQCRRDSEARPRRTVEVEGPLHELGEVSLVAVASKQPALSRLWNGLLDAHHPLGRGPLCGAQQRYLIRSERVGWLGGLAFRVPPPGACAPATLGSAGRPRPGGPICIRWWRIAAFCCYRVFGSRTWPPMCWGWRRDRLRRIGRAAMVIRRCCWRALSMKARIPAPVIARRTGNGSERRPDGADRIATTRVPGPPRRSMYCPWTRRGVRH